MKLGTGSVTWEKPVTVCVGYSPPQRPGHICEIQQRCSGDSGSYDTAKVIVLILNKKFFKNYFNLKIMNIYGLAWGFDIRGSSSLSWLFLATLPDLGWQGIAGGWGFWESTFTLRYH